MSKSLTRYEELKARIFKEEFGHIILVIKRIERAGFAITASSLRDVMNISACQAHTLINTLLMHRVLFEVGDIKPRHGQRTKRFAFSGAKNVGSENVDTGAMRSIVDIKAVRSKYAERMKNVPQILLFSAMEKLQPAIKSEVACYTGMDEAQVSRALTDAFKSGWLCRVKKGTSRKEGYEYIYSSNPKDLEQWDRNSTYKKVRPPKSVHTSFATMRLV